MADFCRAGRSEDDLKGRHRIILGRGRGGGKDKNGELRLGAWFWACAGG